MFTADLIAAITFLAVAGVSVFIIVSRWAAVDFPDTDTDDTDTE